MMINKQVPAVRAVFFDVDGVLLDSLSQHLDFCSIKATEYHLSLSIPSPQEFRRSVALGTQVGPMVKFFLAVGFPSAYIERAVAEYESEFSQRFKPKQFPGVPDLLNSLTTAGLHLGIVTSNIRKNVETALHNVLPLFDPNCLFYFDRAPSRNSKHQCLSEGATVLGLPPDDCVYVGDQPSDAAAAQAAAVRFLGVTYGWSAHFPDSSTEVAETVPDMGKRLLAPR